MTKDVFSIVEDKHFPRNNNSLTYGTLDNDEEHQVSANNHDYGSTDAVGKEYHMKLITVPQLPAFKE